jgi:hypothetical protein
MAKASTHKCGALLTRRFDLLGCLQDIKGVLKMARRVTPAQLQSIIRQEEARRQHEINAYNSNVRRHNNKVRQAVEQQNRKNRQEVDRYNREARAHNAKVRANRQRLQAELNRLARQPVTTRFVVVQQSTVALHQAFERVEVAAEQEQWTGHGDALVDLAEGEAANSAATANILLGNGAGEGPEIESTVLTDELRVISADLDDRWQGALYSINPQNPDAARHFCTSSREILTRIIDLKAPDELVRAEHPQCRLTDDGRVIRRDKVGFLLTRSATDHESLGDFVDTDVDDVLGLFRVFNDGTHGDAGALDVGALRALKGRVEGAIRFLSAVVRGA